jgi:hypothetical protein
MQFLALHVCLSVHIWQLGSQWANFCEFYTGKFLLTSVDGFSFRQNPTKNNSLYKYIYNFMILSCWILLVMKKASEKHCRENQNTYFMSNILFWNLHSLLCSYEKYCRRDIKDMFHDLNMMWHHADVICMLDK